MGCPPHPSSSAVLFKYAAICPIDIDGAPGDDAGGVDGTDFGGFDCGDCDCLDGDFNLGDETCLGAFNPGVGGALFIFGG
jgi:hypothetical protein